MEKLKIFISSDMEELKNERRDAERVIYELNQEPILFEKFPASPNSPVELCLEEVKDCDMYILLIGKNYSDVTKREYMKAIQTKKDILVFIKEVKCKERKTEIFIEDILKPKHTYTTFHNRKELAEKIKDAILYRLVVVYRKR